MIPIVQSLNICEISNSLKANIWSHRVPVVYHLPTWRWEREIERGIWLCGEAEREEERKKLRRRISCLCTLVIMRHAVWGIWFTHHGVNLLRSLPSSSASLFLRPMGSHQKGTSRQHWADKPSKNKRSGSVSSKKLEMEQGQGCRRRWSSIFTQGCRGGEGRWMLWREEGRQRSLPTLQRGRRQTARKVIFNVDLKFFIVFPQIQLPEWLHLQGWRRSTGGKIAKLQNGTNMIFFSAFILFCPWRPASRVHGRLPLVLWRRLWTWVLGDTIRGLPQNRKFRCPLS